MLARKDTPQFLRANSRTGKLFSLGHGDTFGELALLSSSVSLVSITSLTVTRVLYFPALQVLEIIMKDPHLRVGLFSLLLLLQSFISTFCCEVQVLLNRRINISILGSLLEGCCTLGVRPFAARVSQHASY